MYTKGIVRAYDTATGLVTVEMVGSHPYYVDLPAATHLKAQVLKDGKRCLVIMFDETNPDDGLVVATYDEVATLITPSNAIDLDTANANAADEITLATTAAASDVTNMTLTIPNSAVKLLGLLLATVRLKSAASPFGIQFYEVDADSDNAIGEEWYFSGGICTAYTPYTIHLRVSGGEGVTGYKLKWRRASGTSTLYMDVRRMTWIGFGAA